MTMRPRIGTVSITSRIASTATSLLCLLGVEADPIQSREHILLSTLFARAWTEGQDLDLGALIRQIQEPPVARIGVLELDSFYPAKERFGLSMRLNNLLAAPGFEAWTRGEPLSADRLLFTAAGQPRVSVISIAEILQLLHLQHQSGALLISNRKSEITLFVREGNVDFARFAASRAFELSAPSVTSTTAARAPDCAPRSTSSSASPMCVTGPGAGT